LAQRTKKRNREGNARLATIGMGEILKNKEKIEPIKPHPEKK